MEKRIIELAQRILKDRGYPVGSIDGIIGPKTIQCLYEYHDKTNLYGGSRHENQIIALIQIESKAAEINAGPVDGFLGPMTDYAIEQLIHMYSTNGRRLEDFRSEEGNEDTSSNPNPNHWPLDRYEDMVRFYGEPGTNLTSLILPYEMKVAWDTDQKVSKITCHKKVKSSIEIVMEEVLDHYGMSHIEEYGLDLFGGCYNKRKKRGGSTWSTHAWAVAIDIDPARNRLRWGKDRAQLAKPEYSFFWKAWERQGWISLGRLKNYDYMHIQAART